MTKKIYMDTNDNLLTERGPMPLSKGNTYDVPDWAAASLIGRGFAHEVTEQAAGTQNLPAPVIDFDPAALGDMNIAELRDLAKSKGVEDFKTMKKADLVKVLQSLAEKNSAPPVADEVKPPQPAFEAKPLTGQVQPPEFKK